MNLLETFVNKGILTSKGRIDVETGLSQNRTLVDTLSEYGVSLIDALTQVGADYGIPGRVLGDPPANEEVFKYIPIESARHYGFVPLDKVDGALEVGVTDPDNIEAMDALQFISGKIGIPYKIFLITDQDFKRVLDSYQNLSGEVGKALSEYETTEKPISTSNQSNSDISLGIKKQDTGNELTLDSKEVNLTEDAPVTKIVSTILRHAIEGHSSDIHIEPFAKRTRVRFRLDGKLYTSLELPIKVHEAVVARIKILAKLRLDEKRKPQDGRFSANVDNRRIDFRVSTFPTVFGEKVVMRILDQSDATATLDTVGLRDNELKKVRAMMKSPYGIVLITGPTGSGKSTTLFSILSEIDREKYNVVSLEDPVEYKIPGVAQSQVRPEIGYTFANGLRSILRQDPDIIMVGEIRDKETATLAVQAALTGHLVFSTLHTNTASGAIPRLIDMGVDPFLIAPTLIAVIGQRLVRKLCDGAKSFSITESLKEFLDREFEDLPQKYRTQLPSFKEFYHATATDECPNGTRGRTGIFEILNMDKNLEKIILKEPIEEDIYTAARANGMLTMREDAIIKALNGEVPFEDINTLGGELFPEKEKA